MIFAGKQAATLHAVRLVDIHGTRFYDIEYAHDDAPGALRSARIGTESAYEHPQAGDRVEVSYLMNVVTAIARR